MIYHLTPRLCCQFGIKKSKAKNPCSAPSASMPWFLRSLYTMEIHEEVAFSDWIALQIQLPLEPGWIHSCEAQRSLGTGFWNTRPLGLLETWHSCYRALLFLPPFFLWKESQGCWYWGQIGEVSGNTGDNRCSLPPRESLLSLSQM